MPVSRQPPCDDSAAVHAACCLRNAWPAAAESVHGLHISLCWASLSCFLHPAAGRPTRGSATHLRRGSAPTEPVFLERGASLLPRCSMRRQQFGAGLHRRQQQLAGAAYDPQLCSVRQQQRKQQLQRGMLLLGAWEGRGETPAGGQQMRQEGQGQAAAACCECS